MEYGARLVLGFVKPIELAGTAPGGVANYAMVPLLLVLLWLSLRDRRTPHPAAAVAGGDDTEDPAE